MMKIPVATYRLQFTPSFGFADAQAIAPYLSALGVSDIYASPILQSRQGSTHGYDGVDPTRIDPELGGEEAFEKLAAVLVRVLRHIGELQGDLGVDEVGPPPYEVSSHGPGQRATAHPHRARNLSTDFQRDERQSRFRSALTGSRIRPRSSSPGLRGKTAGPCHG